VYGESLFPITASAGLEWARRASDVDIVSVEPRYLPRSLKWVVDVPFLREIVTWNLMLVLRRRGGTS